MDRVITLTNPLLEDPLPPDDPPPVPPSPPLPGDEGGDSNPDPVNNPATSPVESNGGQGSPEFSGIIRSLNDSGPVPVQGTDGVWRIDSDDTELCDDHLENHVSDQQGHSTMVPPEGERVPGGRVDSFTLFVPDDRVEDGTLPSSLTDYIRDKTGHDPSTGMTAKELADILDAFGEDYGIDTSKASGAVRSKADDDLVSVTDRRSSTAKSDMGHGVPSGSYGYRFDDYTGRRHADTRTRTTEGGILPRDYGDSGDIEPGNLDPTVTGSWPGKDGSLPSSSDRDGGDSISSGTNSSSSVSGASDMLSDSLSGNPLGISDSQLGSFF